MSCPVSKTGDTGRTKSRSFLSEVSLCTCYSFTYLMYALCLCLTVCSKYVKETKIYLLDIFES